MPPSFEWWYNFAIKSYASFPLLGLVGTQVNAPFGRFSADSSVKKTFFSEKWNVNGRLAWVLMELPSPMSLLYFYSTAPLSKTGSLPPLASPASALVGLYLIHYLNRAIISPLRAPSRSPSHLIVPLIAGSFNILNGGLMGTYLSSSMFADRAGFYQPSFWTGVVLVAVGMAGNIWHDEVLHGLRRRPDPKTGKPPRYAIPYGGLYKWISYPNYLTEWFEWIGFAIAASAASFYEGGFITPPWLFVIMEVASMTPRAIAGHRWYKSKFEDYPQERKAVIPFLL